MTKDIQNFPKRRSLHTLMLILRSLFPIKIIRENRVIPAFLPSFIYRGSKIRLHRRLIILANFSSSAFFFFQYHTRPRLTELYLKFGDCWIFESACTIFCLSVFVKFPAFRSKYFHQYFFFFFRNLVNSILKQLDAFRMCVKKIVGEVTRRNNILDSLICVHVLVFKRETFFLSIFSCIFLNFIFTANSRVYFRKIHFSKY